MPTPTIHPPGRTEKRKYELMWEIEDYRRGSPEMAHLPELIEFIRAAGRPTGETRGLTPEFSNTPGTCSPRPTSRRKTEPSTPTPQQSEIWPHLQRAGATGPLGVNIYGCGPGRAGLELALLGHEVHMLDIAHNALDPLPATAVNSVDIPLYFHVGELQNAATLLPCADIGYCCDVLEHLPTPAVAPALRAIATLTPGAYMTVCHMKDGFGARIDDVLHMTVQPHGWWLEQIQTAWFFGKIESIPSRSTSVYTTEPICPQK